jgi:hypothetical protein
MTYGRILFVVAAVILFLGGIRSPLIPDPMIWALFCIALGLVFDDIAVRRFW